MPADSSGGLEQREFMVGNYAKQSGCQRPDNLTFARPLTLNFPERFRLRRLKEKKNYFAS